MTKYILSTHQCHVNALVVGAVDCVEALAAEHLLSCLPSLLLVLACLPALLVLAPACLPVCSSTLYQIRLDLFLIQTNLFSLFLYTSCWYKIFLT